MKLPRPIKTSAPGAGAKPPPAPSGKRPPALPAEAPAPASPPCSFAFSTGIPLARRLSRRQASSWGWGTWNQKEQPGRDLGTEYLEEPVKCRQANITEGALQLILEYLAPDYLGALGFEACDYEHECGVSKE